MKPVSVFVDEAMASRFGPQVYSTLRYALIGGGLAWTQVPAPDAACDLAYVVDPLRSCARLTIRADAENWEHPEAFRLDDASSTPGRDVVFEIFWLLTGQDEARWPRDRHGFMDLSSATPERRRCLTSARASEQAQRLATEVTRRAGIDPLPRWPDGKVAAAAASHDVDYPEVLRWIEPFRVIMRAGAGRWRASLDVAMGRRTHWQFESWMALERSLGYRSAFYFTTRRGSLVGHALGTPDPFYDITGPRFQRLFERLRSDGFEVGLHASYRACETSDTIAGEKQALEAASGGTVTGGRHHYWRLLPGDAAGTLRQHERAGLAYDASLAHNHYIGWRRASTWPFFPFDATLGRDLTTLQLPTGWMDAQLFVFAARNPPEDRHLLLRALADTVASHGGCLLVDVHDYVYDDVLFPGWADAYRQLFLSLAERGDIWLATPSEIAAHWRRRHHAIVKRSSGLDARNGEGP